VKQVVVAIPMSSGYFEANIFFFSAVRLIHFFSSIVAIRIGLPIP
jgi:hypothetical protein